MAKKYALLIANTEYRDSKLASLSHPGLAFGELADALKDPARGAFNQVETLVNANLSHVLSSLDRFFSRKPADAVLLVYVGGHGFVDPQGELFLALKESDRIRLKSTALMAAVLGMNMDQCPSPHKVLLLDCHYHSPFQDVPAGAPLRIEPARIFAGRGLPKVIFATGESAPGPVSKPPPPTATPITGKLPVTPRDFTRTLAETLRTPSSMPGSHPAFTVEDWWREVAAELKASRAEAPLRHTVGDPPTTVLRGASLQRPDLSLSGHTGDTSFLPPPLAPEPEGDWTRLSGIFPLEMIAPELAAASRAEAPAGPAASGDSPVVDAGDMEPLHLFDTEQAQPSPAMSSDTPPVEMPAQGGGDGFAALRARLEAQEQEEKEAHLRQEREEAAQRERLNHWKRRWSARMGDGDPEEGVRPPQPSPAGAADRADERPTAAAPAHTPSEYRAKVAALQKTFLITPSGAEPLSQSLREPPPPAATAPAQGVPNGLATVIMPKDQFLSTGANQVGPPLSPGATLVFSREEFLGGSDNRMDESPGAKETSTVSGNSNALPPVGSPPAAAPPGGRRLALWILAGLLPIGFGLFAYFGYLSGLFTAFGLDGPQGNIQVAPLPTEPLPPEVPQAAEQPIPPAPSAPSVPPPPLPAPSLPAATRTVPARASAPKPARAAPMAPSPAAQARQNSLKAFKDSVRAETFLRASVAQAQSADTENLRGLYNRFVLSYPGLEGEVVISLLVAPDGEIEKGSLTSSTTGLSMFDRVVLGNVMGWKLRPFRGAEARSISVTLRFPME